MTDTLNTVKVKGRKRATLALLVSLATLGTSGYLYYQGIKVHTQTVYQIQSLDSTEAANSLQLQNALENFDKQMNALNEKVDAIGSNRFSANNYQINTLVSLANQSLVAYHDVNAAIKLLNYALNIAQSNNDAVYTELKAALTTDIDKLKQLPALDRVIIATKLNNIIANTDNLQLIVTSEPIASIAADNESNSAWQMFLSNIKTKLFNLVQISGASKSDALNLLPQNEVIIHQNVKLDILNARMALLQNDEANWRYSLNAAKQSLAAYFTDNANMKDTLDKLDQLQQLDISYSEAGIEETLRALNNLNNMSPNDMVR